uniref:RING-type E3 ubiquitin transferase n=2 Tax=Salmo trutta TaxID=8032 RepID=A0A673W6V6_SALTR
DSVVQMASFPDSDLKTCPLCKELCRSSAPLSSNSSTSSSSSHTSTSSSTSSSRRLHVLPCLHAFCRQCLEDQRNPGDPLKLRCPICDQKVLMPVSGVDALPSSNFLFSNMLDAVVNSSEEQINNTVSSRGNNLSHRHSREPLCSSCNEGNPATSHCRDCQEYLCNNCVWAHQRVRLTKDHFIDRLMESLFHQHLGNRTNNSNNTPTATLSRSSYSLLPVFQDRLSFCQEHDNAVLHLFCDTCSVPVCREGSVGCHSGHSLRYLQDSLQDSRTLTIQLLADAQRGRHAVQLSIEKAQAVAEQVELKAMVVQSEVKAITERHKKVEKIRQVKAKSLYLQLEKLHQNLTKLDSTIATVTQVLEKGSSLDLLLARESMLLQITELKALRELLLPQDDDRILFTAPDQTLLLAIQSLGLVSSGAFAPLTKAQGEGLCRGLQGKQASFTVVGYDHDGEPRLSGGDGVSAVVVAPDGNLLNAEVSDHQNGLYTVSYLPKVEGEHLVSVLICNQHIEGSPFKALVKSGRSYGGIPLRAAVSAPWGVCVDKEGYIIVADRSNNRVQIFKPCGSFTTSLVHAGLQTRPFGPTSWGWPATARGESSLPTRIITASRSSPLKAGSSSSSGRRGTKTGQFSYPWDVAVRLGGKDPRLRHPEPPHPALQTSTITRLLIIRPDCQSARFLGSEGTVTVSSCDSQGVAVDQEDRIVGGRLPEPPDQVFQTNGNFLCKLGTQGSSFGQMDRPSGIAVTPDGRIVAVDFGNNRIIMF